ncbi:MAG: DsbA family oxidoreductase, partial [Endozoicomonadaceae bacterium]|nr:DsbA family oxidoreductase [Endozoicomonadaceae bacterium]
SLKAHSLLQHFQELGHGEAFCESLLRAYFLEARDIGDDSVLLSLSADFGGVVDISVIVSRYASMIEASQGDATAANIGGVPFYIINSKYGLGGAQSPQAFLQAFEVASKNKE